MSIKKTYVLAKFEEQQQSDTGMREYVNKKDDDKIRRMKERRTLMWKMDEEAYEQKNLHKKSSLEIGAPDDKYEQEADAVAAKVVSGDAIRNNSVSGESSGIQPKQDNNNILMAKSMNGQLHATEDLQSALNSSKGNGQTLDRKVQSDMGSKMDADLSDVKVHTDNKAAEMAEGINAKAFTHGQDIYFNRGNFDTNTNEGKGLLAHELAHTQQQKGGFQRKIQRFEGVEHKKMGNDGSETKKVKLSEYITVTLGDLTALAGDYFGSVEELKKIANVNGNNGQKPASVDEINYIIEYHIDGQDSDPKVKNKYSEKVRTSADARATNLLMTNWSHFSNSNTGDEKKPFSQKANVKDENKNIMNNETGYHQNHDKAIELAFNAGKIKDGKMDEAWLYEGFASHFLTDAFSAGHVRVPRKTVADYWGNKIPMFSENMKGWVLEYLVKGAVISGITKNVEYGVLMWQVEDMLPAFSFGDVIGGILHDTDNENGLEVTVSGKPEVLYGDGQIIDKQNKQPAKGQETLNLATGVVKKSVDEVQKAFDLGKANKLMKEPPMKKQLQNKEGLYTAETMWPITQEKQVAPERQQMNWKVDSFTELLKVPGMLDALTKYCNGKIAKGIEDKKNDLTGPKKKVGAPGLNLILKKFRGTSDVIKATLQEIIDYTPGAISDTSGWFGAAGDDRAVEYFEKAKDLNALPTLTLVQRKRLLKDGLSGVTVGSDDKMISGIITSTPEKDIRSLFTSLNSDDQTGWDWIFSDLSGNELNDVVNYAGPPYWEAASYDEKFNECYSLIGYMGVEFPGAISPGPTAQIVIMIILRSDETKVENQRLDGEFELKRVLDDKYEYEIEELVGPR